MPAVLLISWVSPVWFTCETVLSKFSHRVLPGSDETLPSDLVNGNSVMSTPRAVISIQIAHIPTGHSNFNKNSLTSASAGEGQTPKPSPWA